MQDTVHGDNVCICGRVALFYGGSCFSSLSDYRNLRTVISKKLPFLFLLFHLKEEEKKERKETEEARLTSLKYRMDNFYLTQR